MASALLFPASKMREIATAEFVAQLFVHSLFAKSADEARKHNRMPATLRDFVSVVASSFASMQMRSGSP
jgi:hypothetical protein